MNQPKRRFADIQTLAQLFQWRVAQSPQDRAYQQFDDTRQQWETFSWQQIGARADLFRRALARLQLTPGSRVAILLPNGVDTVAMDQAVLACACVPVPMHALDNPASIAYIVADSDASLLVATSSAQWAAIRDAGTPMPALREVVVLDPDQSGTDQPGQVTVHALEDWLALAPEECAQPEIAAQPDDLAALVYTSGTTGKPKGVMLSHQNVLSNVMAVLQRVQPGPEELFLSFLPLSHTFERTVGYYLPIACGCCVAYSRSAKLLAEDMKMVRPTVLVSVPRIYERAYAAIDSALENSALKRPLFELTEQVGWRRFLRSQRASAGGILQSVLDSLLWPVLDHLVASKIRAQFGGRIRFAVSGGAALGLPMARCFIAMGIPIVQGYGMTETSPIVAANAPEDNDPATVGRVLPGVEIRIGDNRELQVRGPNIMRGYWKREADTQLAFIDGWLRTGDQAAIEEGRVRILGRVKEIIVTSTGEKIAPTDVELAILADRSFEQAYAFGDDRPFIGCAVVLNATYWTALAQQLHLDPAAEASLKDAGVRTAVLERIRDLTTSLPYYAQPRAVIVTLAAWNVENTLLTPTLKLKRNNLARYFETEVNALYVPGAKR